MLSRNQMMSAQTANAIMMQQQQQQRRLQAGGHHRGTGLHPGAAANPLPTVIPHNSANVESQLLCNYSQYLCRREKVNSHDYCSRHILEEKSAPYKPCNFQYARIHPHRKCPRPALKTDRKDGFCAEHTRKAMVARQKSLRKRPPSDPTHRILDELSHYKQAKTEVKTESNSASGGDFEDLEKDITPFEISKQPTKLPSPQKHKEFDFGSEDDSEVDSITVENTWRGDSDSDDDSVDSEMENPLKHAGAYSAEEVIRIMRDKLVRLQKLYIDQFQRLQYLLKEERRQYKTALRKEHEAELMSIQKQPKETPEDKIAYDQLKALNHYNKPAGMEAVLHAKLMERRIQANSNATNANSNLISTTVPGSLAGKLNTTSPIVAKCSFNFTSSTKCGDICIPMTKFCQKHIINDPNQVLFRRCGFVVASEDEYHTDDGPCETPIPDVFDTSTCVYHTQFQQPFRTSLIELDAMAKLKQRDENEKKRAQLATDAMNMMQTGPGTDLNPAH